MAIKRMDEVLAAIAAALAVKTRMHKLNRRVK